MGAKIIPIMKSVGRTVLGVSMGCHALSLCCLNAVSTSCVRYWTKRKVIMTNWQDVSSCPSPCCCLKSLPNSSPALSFYWRYPWRFDAESWEPKSCATSVYVSNYAVSPRTPANNNSGPFWKPKCSSTDICYWPPTSTRGFPTRRTSHIQWNGSRYLHFTWIISCKHRYSKGMPCLLGSIYSRTEFMVYNRDWICQPFC